jgi:glycosyltransferase involved in cell wall biosynthesis
LVIQKLAIFNTGALFKHRGEYYYDSSLYGFVQELGGYFQNVAVLVPVREEPPAKELPSLDTNRVEVLELPWYSNIQTSWTALGRYLLDHRRWRNQLRGFDAIILMDYLFPFYWFFYLLAKLSNVQVFQYMRANDRAVIRSGEYSRIQKMLAVVLSEAGFHLLRFLSKRTPTLVAGKELYEIFSRASPHVRSISPSSVSFRDVSPSPAARFNQEKLRLLSVGRLQRAKGLEELMKAIEKVADKAHRFEVSIVGRDAHGGRYLEKLKEEVARLGLRDVVRFHGHVPFGEDLMKFYRESAVFVLPSYSEGRPKVLYEAMISGMAIIATKTGGIPEVIEHGVNGLLIEPGDVDGLAALLARACEDRKMLQRLSESAARRATEFTVERSAKHAADAIRQVVTLHSIGRGDRG